MRKLRQVMAKYEIEPDVDKIQAKIQKEFAKLDSEEKCMVVGAVLCAVMLVLFVFKSCCCRRRAGPLSEEELLGKLKPVVTVPLQKQEGEKLGMAITPSGQDSFIVTSVG